MNSSVYKFPCFKDNSIITAGPTSTIIPSDNNCPMTCQLIIIYIPYCNIYNNNTLLKY